MGGYLLDTHAAIWFFNGNETLPMIHRDPFDRLLIATAICEQMILITADANIARYDVSHIW